MTNERETLKVTEPQDTHTIGLLKTGIPETLRRWRDSDDKLTIESFELPSGLSISSVSKRHAALALETGMENGEIVFVVTNSQKIEPEKLSLSGLLKVPGQIREGYLTAGIFPGDLPTRGMKSQTPLEKVIEHCFAQTFRTDLALRHSDVRRGQVLSKGVIFKITI